MESWFQAVVHHLPTRNAPEGSRHLQTNSPFSSCHSEILVILPCGFLRFKFNHPSCPRVCKKKILCSGHTGLWVLWVTHTLNVSLHKLMRLNSFKVKAQIRPLLETSNSTASSRSFHGSWEWILFAFAAFSLFLYYTGRCESGNGDLTVCLFLTYTLQWFVYGRDLLALNMLVHWLISKDKDERSGRRRKPAR